MRAREPDRVGDLDRDGVPIHYEVFGSGEPVRPPPDAAAASRSSTGVSGRPRCPTWRGTSGWSPSTPAATAVRPAAPRRPSSPTRSTSATSLAVMDDLGVDAAFLVALCGGARVGAEPGRTAARSGCAAWSRSRRRSRWRSPTTTSSSTGGTRAGTATTRAGSDYHSALHVRRGPLDQGARGPGRVGAADRRGDAARADARRPRPRRRGRGRRRWRASTCPVLVIHGTEDNCQPARARHAARRRHRRPAGRDRGRRPPAARPAPGAGQHAGQGVRRHAHHVHRWHRPATPWLFARERKRRALWVCSPIGLGHVLRDLAIARALRAQVPDLEIEWLAQPPVSDVRGARTARSCTRPAPSWPRSRRTGRASPRTTTCTPSTRSAGWTRSSAPTTCSSTTWSARRPTTCGSATSPGRSTTSCTRTPSARSRRTPSSPTWSGFLPVDPEGDPREAELCADYNAEMIEHRERFPYVRDRSVFIGGFDELPDASLGAGLPTVREWTERWFTSVPYVVPFDPAAYRRPAAAAPRARLRHRLPALPGSGGRHRGRAATCSS